MQYIDKSAQIIQDLLTEEPHYNLYNAESIGDAILIKLLASCISTREKLGLHALKCKLENIKQSNASLYHRLVETEEKPSPKVLPPRDTASLVFCESSMPTLPEHAQCEIGLLPTVSPWLTDYIDYSKSASPEGYRDFHLACGLWVLSTVAARRLQVPQATPVLTPLTLIMVARTSLFAKSTTARAGTMLLRAAGLQTLLGDDETTPQRLLYDMAGHMPTNWRMLSADDQEETLSRLAFSAQRGWYYDELGQLLNAMARPTGPMADFTGLLRKLDNCDEDYRYSTKAGGQERIRKPYLSLLGSTTPANLSRHMGSGCEFWGDGFWARALFVCPDPHAFITQTADDNVVRPTRRLIEPLRAWHERLGVPHVSIDEQEDPKSGKGTGIFFPTIDPLPTTDIKLASDARNAYERYRVALRQIIAERVHGQDLDGSYARLPTQALRIAALIASIEGYQCITIDVWSVAQEIAEVFRANLHSLYQQVSESPEENPVEELLISYLKGLGSEGYTNVRTIRHEAHPTIRKMKPDAVRDLLNSLMKDGIVSYKRDGRVELYGLVN